MVQVFALRKIKTTLGCPKIEEILCCFVFWLEKFWDSPPALKMERFKSNRGAHINSGYDATLDEPPVYEETNFSNKEHRTVRPSVMSAFGHDTLDRVPNIDFYRNAGSLSGQRAVRPSLQELHDVFQKVSTYRPLLLFHFAVTLNRDHLQLHS